MDLRIYAVFKTHFDIGFTELSKEVISKYSQKMLGDVIKTCEETKALGEGRQYVWTMSSWPLVKTIEKGLADEEKRQVAIKLIKDGQITWHALPYTTHTEFCGLEEYIRGLHISTNLSHEYGYWPISAKMTDVPGHTYILPTILAGAGIKFLHLGCNPGCMAPDVPRLFWWEGPDGGRVLTFYSKGSYGTDFVPPEDWQYPAWLAMLQTNDNIGPQGPEIIKLIEDTVYKEYPNAKIHVGTMDDFYNDIIQSKLDIPVIKMDLADSWIHGAGTYPLEVSRLRRARGKLLEGEKLLSYLSILNSKLNTESDFSKIDVAFDSSLLFGEHTWGLDVKTHMGAFRHYTADEFAENRESAIYKHMEASWNEQRERANCAMEISDTILSQNGQILADSVCIQGDRIVVFNGSGKKGDAWVDFGAKTNSGYIDTRNGERLKTRYFEGKVQAFVKDLPAFGYVSISVINKEENNIGENDIIGTEDNDFIKIENSFYRIVANKATGALTSFIDLNSNKDWVDSDNKEGFGAYRYDTYGIEDVTSFTRDYSYRFYDWLVNDLGRINYPQCPHRTLFSTTDHMKLVLDENSARIVINSSGSKMGTACFGDCEKIITTISIFAFDKEVKIKYELKNKHETSMIEAGHFVFPLKLDRPRYRINKIGSVIDPACDIMKDANNILYCLDNWVDINDGNHGFTIVSHDIPLFSIGDEGIYKYRKEYKESKPWIYFNAFNNAWGTNFPQWMGGDFTFEFSVFTHMGDWQEGSVSGTTTKLIEPPIAFFGTGNSGELHPNADLIEIEGNIIISAFTKSKYTPNAYILRLRDTTGVSSEATIKIPLASTVTHCDLQERIFEEQKCNKNSFTLQKKPFGIYSFIVEF